MYVFMVKYGKLSLNYSCFPFLSGALEYDIYCRINDACNDKGAGCLTWRQSQGSKLTVASSKFATF